MSSAEIYGDIARRTGGDIYIGVVGPVRTGKSTFIKKFMDTIVIPNIGDQYRRARTQDELPQSAAGRTIMTTEPKFIPNEAVSVSLDGNTEFRVRLIDCVGYIVDSARGHTDEDGPRMVSTPWFEEDIEFDKAAEIGTRKVICEHSTIGIVMTTDGSICDIPRSDYVSAEERVVAELREIDKPFIIVLNSAAPASAQTQKLRRELEEKYSTPVVAVSCLELSGGDIEEIIKTVLYEFPVSELSVELPRWIDALPMDHYLKKSVFSAVRERLLPLCKISQIKAAVASLAENEYIKSASVERISPDKGNARISVAAVDGLFYRVISETTGIELKDDEALIDFVTEMAKVQKKYSKLEYALHEVEQTGYGIVFPSIEELTLKEPEIMKQGGRFGVRLRASAPSIHLIKAQIETEINPIVGSEKQSEDLVNYLMSEFESDPIKIWGSNIFGKSLHELVNEGLNTKLSKMPSEARSKLQETLEKIINEGSGGLICIIL